MDRLAPTEMTAAAKKMAPSRMLRLRMRKQDSALVYFVLEAHEGICSYSTLPFQPGDAFRDMILRIPPGFEGEVQQALAPLREKIYELE